MISPSSDCDPMCSACPKSSQKPLDGSACLLGNAPRSGASPQRLNRLSTLPAFNVWSRKASTHYSPEGSFILVLSAFVCLITLSSDVICSTRMHTRRGCNVVPMRRPAEQNFISSARMEDHSSSSNPPALILIPCLYPKQGKTGVDCSLVIAARVLLSGYKNCQQLFVGGYGLSELCGAGKGRHNLKNDPLQQRQEAMFRSAGQPDTRRAQLHLCWTVPLFLTLQWTTDSSPTCPGIPVRWF